MNRVAVESVGCVSAVGFGVNEMKSALQAGESGVSDVEVIDASGCRANQAAQICSQQLLDEASSISSRAGRWPRAGQMLRYARAEALSKCPGVQPDLVVVGTTSGGMELGEEYFRRTTGGAELSSARRLLRAYLPQSPVHDAMRALSINAPVRIVSNACASGTNALGIAWRLLRAGRCRRILVAGYDALAQLVYAGFDCLQALSTTTCRPFDSGRDGLVLGEGAAAFCLGKEGAVSISGYGAATDTHHLTQPNPNGSGPAMAMRGALGSAGLPANEVGYVNAHGTGTPQNDACEAQAILDVCPQVAVSSTKAFTGHTLGAAGTIEAVITHEALVSQFLPANLNLERAEAPLDLVVSPGRTVSGVRHMLSNSFGFGGANASVLLSL